MTINVTALTNKKTKPRSVVVITNKNGKLEEYSHSREGKVESAKSRLL